MEKQQQPPQVLQQQQRTTASPGRAHIKAYLLKRTVDAFEMHAGGVASGRDAWQKRLFFIMPDGQLYYLSKAKRPEIQPVVWNQLLSSVSRHPRRLFLALDGTKTLCIEAPSAEMCELWKRCLECALRGDPLPPRRELLGWSDDDVGDDEKQDGGIVLK
jgi:hypothetical protein